MHEGPPLASRWQEAARQQEWEQQPCLLISRPAAGAARSLAGAWSRLCSSRGASSLTARPWTMHEGHTLVHQADAALQQVVQWQG
jgi:hypothetical protein